MIGQLRGRLAEKRPNQVLVDVGGVGYVVQVPLSTYAALGDLHTEVTLLIHAQVREDALALYGFVSAREKHFFEMLLSASGVGPTLALKILSGMSVEELVPAIRGSDLARLTRIPGVGRKTAERMVVELKDKLEAVAVETEKPAASSPAGIEADVISALVNLGYDARAAETAVGEAEPRRSAGPCPLVRPARSWKDHSGANYRQRIERSDQDQRGAAAGTQRRLDRDLDLSRKERSFLSRRNSPLAARRRGSALSRDGGFPRGPDHRTGAGSTDSSLSAGAFHIDRCDDARGIDHRAAAFAVWDRPPAGLLRAAGLADHHSPLGKNSEHPDGRWRR